MWGPPSGINLFLVAPEDVQTVRLWTFNLGFYNMVWGVGAITGALLLGSSGAAGRALLLFTCLGHVFLGLLLLVTERRLWANGVAEAALPLVIVILLLV
ncbi:DUF1304 family protein [Arthrobacter sp. NPDC093139]|uniref:DUF1304 family protein n=1 Tax=Arthrobacter sp. NPDC093139 TaxID=3363945 RepID=UPI0038110E06